MDAHLIDRLMPRHNVGLELPIDWDVRPRRRLFSGTDNAVPALIRTVY